MKALRQYLTKREAIARILATPPSAYTAKTFHTLRVELKKLHALFDLLAWCVPSFKPKKSFKPFKTLFRKAGEVRDLQITEDLLRQYFGETLPSRIRQNLSGLQKPAEAEFFQQASSFRKKLEKIFQPIESCALKCGKKEILRYMKKENEKIGKWLSKEKLERDQLHDLRKRLKAYNYNLAIVGKEELHTQPTQADQLTNLVGKWHDLSITQGYIRNAEKGMQMEPDDSRLLAEIASRLDAECEKAFVEIQNALQNQSSIMNADFPSKKKYSKSQNQ